MAINIWLRRLLALTWLTFGIIPMTGLWVLLDQFLKAIIHADPKESALTSCMAFITCYCTFAFILYLISEIPVRKPVQGGK